MPDGVLAAKSIAPDQRIQKSGTMYGKVVGMKNGKLVVRPRYTEDDLVVSIIPTTQLLKQVNIAVESIKVGDTVTFWGEKRGQVSGEGSVTDLKADALLLGPNRYPNSSGSNGGVYLTGRINALDPDVYFTPKGGKKSRVYIAAQMPTARLDTIKISAIKPGVDVMLVLKRGKTRGFIAETVIIDASPWVGYGG